MADIDKVCILAVVFAVDHDTVWDDLSAVVILLYHGNDVPVLVLHQSELVLMSLVILVFV